MIDYIELGKRLVACKGFRWMPGMLGLRYAVGYIDHGKPELRIVTPTDSEIAEEWGSVPDFSDAATKGCLMQLLRERWDDPYLHVWHSRQLDGWVWVAKGQVCAVYGSADIFPSELEAMLDAWEASTQLEELK